MHMRFHLGGVSEYSVREMETPSSRTIPRIGPIEENNSEWEVWHGRKYVIVEVTRLGRKRWRALFADKGHG